MMGMIMLKSAIIDSCFALDYNDVLFLNKTRKCHLNVSKRQVSKFSGDYGERTVCLTE